MSTLRDRSDDGTFTSDVEDKEVRDFIEPKGRVTTEEVADEFGYTHNGAEKRLKRAERVRSVGSGINIWEVVEEEEGQS